MERELQGGPEAAARRHSGKAILALILGAAAVLAPAPINTPVALVAILVAWKARGELRADPHLRGTVASLAGFILGAGVLVVAFVTFWLPLVVGMGLMAAAARP